MIELFSFLASSLREVWMWLLPFINLEINSAVGHINKRRWRQKFNEHRQK